MEAIKFVYDITGEKEKIRPALDDLAAQIKADSQRMQEKIEKSRVPQLQPLFIFFPSYEEIEGGYRFTCGTTLPDTLLVRIAIGKVWGKQLKELEKHFNERYVKVSIRQFKR